MAADTWIGKRIRTRIQDQNEVERGEVIIPIGWTGRVDSEVSAGEYAVVWDDDAAGLEMGWTIWTAAELARDAEVIA